MKRVKEAAGFSRQAIMKQLNWEAGATSEDVSILAGALESKELDMGGAVSMAAAELGVA